MTDSGMFNKSKVSVNYGDKYSNKDYNENTHLSRNSEIYDDENVPSFGI